MRGTLSPTNPDYKAIVLPYLHENKQLTYLNQQRDLRIKSTLARFRRKGKTTKFLRNLKEVEKIYGNDKTI